MTTLSLEASTAPITTELPFEYREHTFFETWYSVVAIVIAVVCTASGLVGNSLIIATVAIVPKLRNFGNLFIVNLAITDLWVSAVTQPLSIIGSLGEHLLYYRNPILCEFVATLCLITCTCSLVNVSLISINRMVMVCYNSKYNFLFGHKARFIWLALPWISGFIGDMPNHWYWGLNRHWYDPKKGICMYDRRFFHTYSKLVGAHALFWVTLAYVCYVRIFWYVYQKKNAGTLNLNRDKKTREIINLAGTLFRILIVYTICWGPWAILMIVDEKDEAPFWVYGAAIHLAHTNSSINVFVYGLTNEQFRKGYWRVYARLTCGRVSPLRYDTTTTGRTTTNAPTETENRPPTGPAATPAVAAAKNEKTGAKEIQPSPE